MPRADTLPSFRTEIVEVLSPTNPLGIKAGGEGGTTPAPAVHRQRASSTRCAPLGVRDITMPATPYTIWQAIRAARRAARPGMYRPAAVERPGASIVAHGAFPLPVA